MIRVACDYCGSDDNALVFRARDTNYGFAGEFAIVRCRRCGLVYLGPRPNEHEIGLYYPDGDYNCFKSDATSDPLGDDHHFVKAAKTRNLERGRLCDIGCGSGSFLVSARASGWQVAGVEPNDYARQICQQHLPDVPLYASLTEASFAADSFDAVTMWHVLEHLPSPSETLREINRMLRPGGLLGIALPNFDSIERRIWGPHWISISAPTHLFHFEPATLTQYLDRFGLQVMTVIQLPGANSLAANILRTLRNLLLDPFAAQPRDSSPDPDIAPGSDGAPVRSSPGYSLSGDTKERALRVATRAVYPLAWLNARLGHGSELIVYAYKAK
ncbi:MAG: class I SAM-dependent methyltransferase [Anaerolineae bacterium]|nr:class I SAM-dependent methyltransferase [Anaerolineae bacterium]